MKTIIAVFLMVVPFCAHAGIFGPSQNQLNQQMNVMATCQSDLNTAFTVDNTYTVVENKMLETQILNSKPCSLLDQSHQQLYVAEARTGAYRLAATESDDAAENTRQAVIDSELQSLHDAEAKLDQLSRDAQ